MIAEETDKIGITTHDCHNIFHVAHSVNFEAVTACTSFWTWDPGNSKNARIIEVYIHV